MTPKRTTLPRATTPRALAIITAVADLVECTAEDILGRSMQNKHSIARALAIHVVKEFYLPHPSNVELGILFGRDNSSVIHALRLAAKMGHSDHELRDLYDAAMTVGFEAWMRATPWVQERKAAE